MAALDRAVSPADAMRGLIRIVPWLFAATLSVSAFLLFSIQPMFTKMVLPLLGGAPTVWSIALVFFQAALLGGYIYAHLIVRRVPLGVGALIHLGTLAAAAAMLPIALTSSLGSPPTENIAFWLIGLLRCPSACLLRHWRLRPRCCKAGSPRAAIAEPAIPMFSTLLPISVLLPACLLIRRS